MADQGLTITGAALARGTRQTLTFPLAEQPDGSSLTLSAEILRGVATGPVFYIGSGVHGDEVNGVHMTSRLLTRIDPKRLNGTLIVVPVQNPLGFRSQHRLPLQLVLHSPLDQVVSDMFLAMPGDPKGNTTEQMAHVLHTELISKAEYFIDLHTPTTGGRYIPFVFLPPRSAGPAVARARDMAQAMGVDMILDTEESVYVNAATPHVVGAKRGMVGFGVEMGEGGRHEEEFVERAVRGLLNILRSVGMLEGAVEQFPAPVVLSAMTAVRATRGGLLHQWVGLGDWVKEGQILAEVRSPTGRCVESIAAPHAGLLTRLTTFPAVWSGDRVAQVGVEREPQRHRAKGEATQ